MNSPPTGAVSHTDGMATRASVSPGLGVIAAIGNPVQPFLRAFPVASHVVKQAEILLFRIHERPTHEDFGMREGRQIGGDILPPHRLPRHAGKAVLIFDMATRPNVPGLPSST